ncbi:MAG TPA: DUF2341 domain-containing protein, partial [Methanocella sp.]|nr:DUF2341 domain-containing protein [Methanocella sp.]
MRVKVQIAFIIILAFALSVIPAARASITDYSYVKQHSITGSSDGPLTDYSLKFIVHRGSGNDNGQDVYLNESSVSWPNDIRFADQNKNPLGNWIESSNDSEAIVWVRMDDIPVSGTTVYLYYGKAGDPGSSSIDDAMLWGDDFSGRSPEIDKWQTGVDYYVGNGLISIGGMEPRPHYIVSTQSFSAPYILEYRGAVTEEG